MYNCGYNTNTILQSPWMYSQRETVSCTQNIRLELTYVEFEKTTNYRRCHI